MTLSFFSWSTPALVTSSSPKQSATALRDFEGCDPAKLLAMLSEAFCSSSLRPPQAAVLSEQSGDDADQQECALHGLQTSFTWGWGGAKAVPDAVHPASSP